MANQQGSLLELQLPLATIIETGNMICRCARGERSAPAQALSDIIGLSAKGESPWGVFSDQGVLWEPSQLSELVNNWVPLVDRGRCHSMGDATIAKVAEYYARMGYAVEIFTGDYGLKQFEPTLAPWPAVPRRRK